LYTCSLTPTSFTYSREVLTLLYMHVANIVSYKVTLKSSYTNIKS